MATSLNPKIQFIARVVLDVAAIALLAFAIPVLIIKLAPQKAALKFPTEASVRAGERMLLRFRAKGKFCEDPQLTEAAEKILRSVLPNSDFSYQILIPQNGAISQTALSLPGGKILVGANFISKMPDYRQLAAIVTHEMGHIELRHAERDYLTNSDYRHVAFMELNYLLSSDETLTELADGVVSAMLFKKRNNELELEADRYGLRLMDQAGLAPKDLLTGLSILNNNVPKRAKAQSDDRIVRIKAYIESLPVKDSTAANLIEPAEWESLRSRCLN